MSSVNKSVDLDLDEIADDGVPVKVSRIYLLDCPIDMLCRDNKYSGDLGTANLQHGGSIAVTSSTSLGNRTNCLLPDPRQTSPSQTGRVQSNSRNDNIANIKF